MMRSRLAAHCITMCAALALLIGAPGRARAEAPSANCTFIEIEASLEPGKEVSIPAELRGMEKKLKKPPFASWNRFVVKSRAQKTLSAQKPESIKLELGAASAMLRDVEGSGKRPRYSLALTVDDPSGKRVVDTKVSLTAGDYVVIGRALADNRGHLLAQTCSK